MRIRGGWIGAVAIAAVMVTAPYAEAQTASAVADPIQRANRMAYDASIKCFVVIGVLVGDAKNNNQPDLSAAYDTKARRSFDFALQLGGKLGLSGTHMNEDFGLVQARELPRLVADKAYFRGEAATCKALGLL